MFDAIDDAAFAVAPQTAHRADRSVRALLVAEAEYARASLGALCGAGSSVLVVHPDALAADWPDYIAARARTGGALVVEAADGDSPADFSALAEGRLFGRSARAGIVGGALVFLLDDEAELKAAA